jgi:hypothetical protein
MKTIGWASLALLAGVAAVAGPAAAGDYPYSGVFALSVSETPAETDLARCALSFFTQGSDGAFVSYHVDIAQFLKDKSVRYLPYNNGKCVFDATQKIESCTVAADTDPSSVGRTFYDVLQSTEGPMVKTTMFETLDQAKVFAKDGTVTGGGPMNLYRCPFKAEWLSGVLAKETSRLDLNARNALTAPSDELLAAPRTKALVEAAGLKLDQPQ